MCTLDEIEILLELQGSPGSSLSVVCLCLERFIVN